MGNYFLDIQYRKLLCKMSQSFLGIQYALKFNLLKNLKSLFLSHNLFGVNCSYLERKEIKKIGEKEKYTFLTVV